MRVFNIRLSWMLCAFSCKCLASLRRMFKTLRNQTLTRGVSKDVKPDVILEQGNTQARHSYPLDDR